MNWKRVRKALTGGATTALAVVGTQVAKDGVPANADGWVGLALATVVAFVGGYGAVYAVRNEGPGMVNGSDPDPGPATGGTFGRPAV